MLFCKEFVNFQWSLMGISESPPQEWNCMIPNYYLLPYVKIELMWAFQNDRKYEVTKGQIIWDAPETSMCKIDQFVSRNQRSMNWERDCIEEINKSPHIKKKILKYWRISRRKNLINWTMERDYIISAVNFKRLTR